MGLGRLTAMKALYFQCAARSALGLVRNGNEDILRTLQYVMYNL